MKKPMLNLFMVTHGTGENMNQKNPFNHTLSKRKSP